MALFGIVLRAVIAAICLLPPTLLMGASLPAIARWVEATPEGVSWLGFFYGGNIAGAVFGCLLAGFYLLRVYDMAIATWVGRDHQFRGRGHWRSSYQPMERKRTYDTRRRRRLGSGAARATRGVPPSMRIVYIAIALSGLCALGAEVIWTRLLSLMLGATVYTFSIILAVFLIGLGLGSGVASQLARNIDGPRSLWRFASCCWPARSRGRAYASRFASLLAHQSVLRPAPGSTSSSI